MTLFEASELLNTIYHVLCVGKPSFVGEGMLSTECSCYRYYGHPVHSCIHTAGSVEYCERMNF